MKENPMENEVFHSQGEWWCVHGHLYSGIMIIIVMAFESKVNCAIDFIVYVRHTLEVQKYLLNGALNWVRLLV